MNRAALRPVPNCYPLLMLALATAPALAARPLGDLTGPWQLFVDDYLIAAKEDVVRTYHPFEKHPGNPIMIGDKPWEGGDVYMYGTVLPVEDGQGYRMWYQTIPGKGETPSVLYATSKDGIHWDKPNLGLRDRKGSKDNNMLFPSGKSSFMASVIHTPWNPDPKRRYTAMRLGEGGYDGAWSPDGIRFEDLPGNPVCKGGGDSGQFFWDPHRKQYVGFAKVIRNVDGLRRRTVGRSATKDLASWPEFESCMTPDTFDDRWVKPGTVQRTHFYGVSAFAYERMYIGFLWIYRAVSDEGYFLGTIHVELVTSRDGVHWLREEGDRPPMLPLGKPGTWDDGMLFTPNHPLVEGDSIRLYYSGFDDEHDRAMNGKIGLAFLRKDGFASLDAKDKAGTVLTKRLKGVNGHLHVNCEAKGGSVKVEALDEAGKPLPGYGIDDCQPLVGDGVDQVVAWKSQKHLPKMNSPLRLRFHLSNASLYSFMAGDAVEVIDEPAGPPLGVLYTFEGDGKRSAKDRLAADGTQKPSFIGGLQVTADPGKAAFGQSYLEIGSEYSQYNAFEIGGTTKLGTCFTLACTARSKDNRHARLFSSYGSCGPVRFAELVFDYDPSGKSLAGLRLICKGISFESKPLSLGDGKYHHLAVTYDDGEIRFYADGQDAGRAVIPGGAPVTMNRNLFVGDDAALGQGHAFAGDVDDVLVLGRALDVKEIQMLHAKGAEAWARTTGGGKR